MDIKETFSRIFSIVASKGTPQQRAHPIGYGDEVRVSYGDYSAIVKDGGRTRRVDHPHWTVQERTNPKGEKVYIINGIDGRIFSEVRI